MSSIPVFRIFTIILAWTAAMWVAIGLSLYPIVPGGWLGIGAGAVVSALPSLVFLRTVAQRSYPSARTRLLVFRPFWYVQLALPLVAIAGLLGLIAGTPFGQGQATGRGAIAVAVILYVTLVLAGFFGSRRLTVRRLEATFPDLPDALDGLRIIQLTDLHVGPHTSRTFLARIAESVRGSEPDLIVVTGDQVDDFGPDVAHFEAAFRSLSAPLGIYAVPGNHDVYAGWRTVRDGLQAMGIGVLVNQAVRLRHHGAEFWLAGTGDPAGAQWKDADGASAAPDVDRTLSSIPPGAFTIVLAHNPVLWPSLAARGVRLTLSGHTHYGQIAIPALNWSLASPFLRHAMGVHVQDDSALYIAPGSNFWGIPLRVGAVPEITLITLRRGGTERPANGRPQLSHVATHRQ